MNQATDRPPRMASERRQAALVKLLADDDPAVYQTVRNAIVSDGLEASDWLRRHALSNDPVLRRRVREIIGHFARQEADIQFLSFCLKHGEEFDLEAGAWLLARTQYPDINPTAYQAMLDLWTVEMREHLKDDDSAAQIVGVISQYLFDQLGFTGNKDDYYNPENSYLNRVLDRRTGNPISLCLLFLLLARRLRLPVAGIGLPGHFICRYQSSAVELYLDVFNRGRILTKADCIQYLVRGHYSLKEDFLSPVSARRTLARICGNLQQIYLRRGRAEESTRVQRYLVALAR